MDVKRLTHFIALAEEGRFSQAAARVHLSQAAFSRSIQHLEDQMGFRLVDRGAKGATPTPAGEVVLRRARELVFESRCLQRDIELVKQGDLGVIAIGAGPIPAAVLVPDMLCQLRATSPHLVLNVHMGSLDKLLVRLDAQELDFCLGDPRMIVRGDRYEMRLVGRQHGGLYCRKGHPLLRKRSITPDDLTRYGLAMVSVLPALLEPMAAAMGFASGTALPVAVACDDLHTLAHLVSRTDVLGVLPDSFARSHSPAIRRLKTGEAPTLYADAYAIWLKGRTLAPSARRAIQIVSALTQAQM